MIYTSGTTGRAKGALITHGNLAAIAAQLNEAWRWTSADTLLITLPLFHVHGLCAGLNGTLAAVPTRSFANASTSTKSRSCCNPAT